MKRALITGITGQDGSHLADLLLSKGYEVHGLVRRASTPHLWRIEHILDRITPHEGDLVDGGSLAKAVAESQPDEVYNLAAMSYVATSWDEPVFTMQVNAMGVVRLLDAVRRVCPQARVYQASSSELFGAVKTEPQDEHTPFHPRSPYGVSKAAAYWAAVNYRESFGMHVSNGILFNHEGVRRGEEFVTRKITRAVGRIRKGSQKYVTLGNLDAERDWGSAADFVEAMWLMLQQDEPDDYVVATGEKHTVREFAATAFAVAGLDWKDYVRVDQAFYRPAEVVTLCGDASKARRVLGWGPKTRFADLVFEMVESDLALAERERANAEAVA